MKRRDLIKLLEVDGFQFKRSGGNHDIYKKGNVRIAVPRHSEIKESLVKAILDEMKGGKK